jgi:hypothetical protein
MIRFTIPVLSQPFGYKPKHHRRSELNYNAPQQLGLSLIIDRIDCCKHLGLICVSPFFSFFLFKIANKSLV